MSDLTLSRGSPDCCCGRPFFTVPLTGIEFSPVLRILSLLLPLFFLIGSGYYVIRKELKHSPVELMRGQKEKYRVNFLERVLKLERLNFATKFQIREQLRSLSRLAFLLLGIAVATVLMQWAFPSGALWITFSRAA